MQLRQRVLEIIFSSLTQHRLNQYNSRRYSGQRKCFLDKNHLFSLVREPSNVARCIFVCWKKKNLFYYPNDPSGLPLVNHIAKGEVLKTSPVRWPAWKAVTAVWEENSLPSDMESKSISHPLSSWDAVVFTSKDGLVGHDVFPSPDHSVEDVCFLWAMLLTSHNGASAPETWKQILTLFTQHHWPTPAGSHKKWTEVWTREAFTKTQSLFSGHYLTKLSMRRDLRKLPLVNSGEGSFNKTAWRQAWW